VGGPADQAGIKTGDVILAIHDHYLFTIRELQEEISHHQPGAKIAVRYRRYTTIYDASLVVTRVQYLESEGCCITERKDCARHQRKAYEAEIYFLPAFTFAHRAR
jgi:predicted metalloprotease with PDZ domain